jgi:hypothetical protein
MLDYLRTHVAWLLDYCEKYNIPLEDIEKAKGFFKTSGKILEKKSPTESQHGNKTTEDSTEPKFAILLKAEWEHFSIGKKFCDDLISEPNSSHLYSNVDGKSSERNLLSRKTKKFFLRGVSPSNGEF